MLILTISIVMIALTVGVHSLGASYWLRYLSSRVERFHHHHKEPLIFRPVMSTTIVLVLLHALEACLWAFLYLLLPGHAGLDSFHEAFYFSIVTITTLGYGDITLTAPWHILSGVEGMIGIVVFGLTTAILFAAIQNSWKMKTPPD